MNIREALKHKIDFKTKPVGSLGMLEDVALQIGTIQNSLDPQLKNPVIYVFAGDHGITDEGVSPFPKEVTRQMVLNFLSGGAAINVFCKQNNIRLKIVDAGVDADFDPHGDFIDAKIAKGTKNIVIEPAMTKEQCWTSIKKGSVLVETEEKHGCNIIGFGEMGIGNTSSASLLVSKYCDIPLEQSTGRGTGHDNEGLKRKIITLKKALEKHKMVKTPTEILAAFGGFEIAMMSGAMLKAAELNMTILIDGFITTAALLTAFKINNNVLNNCIFCHQSEEQGHKLVLDYLKVRPLLNLNMRLGEGTGAAIAFPIIKSAVSFLNEMASFESAGISNKK